MNQNETKIILIGSGINVSTIKALLRNTGISEIIILPNIDYKKEKEELEAFGLINFEIPEVLIDFHEIIKKRIRKKTRARKIKKEKKKNFFSRHTNKRTFFERRRK